MAYKGSGVGIEPVSNSTCSSLARLKNLFEIPNPATTMSTHNAVATVGVKAKLGLIHVPTVKPASGQVRVRCEWTASTPLDLHQNDGGLLVQHPQVLGDGTAGTVVEVGPDVQRLNVGDKVFGFTWRSQVEKAHQEYVTVDEWLLAKVSRVVHAYNVC